jgi:septum formation protein
MNRPPSPPVPRLILASRSPRRAALLRQMGFEFSIAWKEVDENLKDRTEPAETVLSLSALKAEAVLLEAEAVVSRTEAVLSEAEAVVSGAGAVPSGVTGGLVVGADTVVVLDGELLGKPESRIAAGRMLRRLSGRTHEVFTGFTLIDSTTGGRVRGVERTAVTFRRLDDWEIDGYVSSGMPMDKAGAYGIQDRSGLFVERIDGCFYNVVGFPLTRFYEGLKELVGAAAVRNMLSSAGGASFERNG